MTKAFTHSWTPAKLANMNRSDLQKLRDNASRHGALDLISMCDEALRTKPPALARIRRTQFEHTGLDVVTGYHFVCGNDLGVTQLENGRFWSGSWVVAEANVRTSIRYGAYLALHQSKATPSYRQGHIIDFRLASRGMVSKIEDGIEFLVEATEEPYHWVGAGAGEKGYRWTKIAADVREATDGSKP